MSERADVTSPDSDDERNRAAVHDVVAGPGDLGWLVAQWDTAEARKTLDRVLADYVVELNRALAAGDGQLFGQDAERFMRQYAELWKVKLSL